MAAARAPGMMRNTLQTLLIAFVLAACGGGQPGQSTTTADGPVRARPNILLIVVDDMGFADLGAFGGEIETPNLDRLANHGIRFTNFHTSTACSPSRAMLLTGVDSHRAGLGNMLEELSPNQKGRPGYEGYLNKRVVTLPTLLRDAGYRTYMTGKWHLGTGPGQGAAYRGFQHSFTLDSGGASHFADMRPAYAPSPEIKANYQEDGKKLTALPDDFEYSTAYYVDRMIDYLQAGAGSAQPFFAYLAFTAPHWPLQAPDAAIAQQSGRYDVGYDVIADRRLERQKALGLVPREATRSSRSPKEVPWQALDADQQRTEARAMEIYAAMVAEIDRHIGRLLDVLEAQGSLDNTLIVFLSDNGPEGHDLDETWPMDTFPDIRRTIDATHDFSFEAMGRPGSYVLYGPNWANAGSPALRLHKGFPTEGGTRVAAFVHDPTLITRPAIVDDYVFITDVVPTLLEIAGVALPGDHYAGRSVEPVSGRSFLPVLRGASVAADERITGVELFGKRAVVAGPWKLVHMPAPYGNGDWQLFNTATDLGEAQDLAARYPDRVKALKTAWDDYAKENGVILPDWVSGY